MTVRSTWICDICGTQLLSDSEDRPAGWQKLHISCNQTNDHTQMNVVCDVDYANFLNGKVVISLKG
jgi:hypothetical protein